MCCIRKDYITIEHINVQSLLSNLNEIKLLASDRNIDVFCISDTWLRDVTPSEYINIPNFTLFRRDGGRGGGICIYVNKQLKSNVIDLSFSKQPGVEDLWVSVQCRMLPAIIIGCVYRHPKAPVSSFEYLQDVFRQLSVCKKGFYVLGDFNDDLFSVKNKLGAIIKNYKLTQLIERPTRVTPTSATLLDLVVTNKPDHVLAKSIVPLVIADHDLISITIDITKPQRQPEIRTLRHFGRYNKDSLCELLLSESDNFNQIMDTDDVNLQVNIFNEIFISCLDKCAPLVTREVTRPAAPWLSDELRLAMKQRDDTRSKLSRDRSNTTLQQQYTDEKKVVKSRIAASIKEYYANKFSDSKGNSSAIWNLIKELVPNKKNKSDVHKLIMLLTRQKNLIPS